MISTVEWIEWCFQELVKEKAPFSRREQETVGYKKRSYMLKFIIKILSCEVSVCLFEFDSQTTG